MHTGGLAQMSHDFASTNLAMPSGGLASRRGGQNIKPLSFEGTKSSTDVRDNGVPTPRTSRGHLLAGLRTAPKSATAASFATGGVPSHVYGRNNAMPDGVYGGSALLSNAPKTSLPRIATQHQGAYNMTGMSMAGMTPQQYTPEQILAPPEFHLDEQVQDQMDPNLYAHLVTANLYLAQQKQRLQQQLLSVQAAAQQFQGMNLNTPQYGQLALQQQLALQALAQQQQQIQAMQQSMSASVPVQQNLMTVYDPNTRMTYLYDQATGNIYENQPSTPQATYFQQPSYATPRVQVSPPPQENNSPVYHRTTSPPRNQEPTAEPTPLPPPSANAFRRGHKKSISVVNAMKNLTVTADESVKSAGPKTASFPLSPLPNGGYGPGQARAGEHPVRQPRGPPALDELRAKPTARHEGSKNFSARTRRSAVHNLMKAGLVRRKGTGSSCGSTSPVSDTADELRTPITDNESESGRSGSGSLSGDAEPSMASSRTSASGSWGAIGSDRPSSRQKSRNSLDSQGSMNEGDHSFASLLKNGPQRQGPTEVPAGQRKAPRLVLTSAEKRKGGVMTA
ncbi:hypothetical protein F5Y17DRAFT_165796 [Xylariaceae sp. FL0594]|nr:hypothetical protein F5Y17DRAFT_165796 [Xylariaceae sp. FL0594]